MTLTLSTMEQSQAPLKGIHMTLTAISSRRAAWTWLNVSANYHKSVRIYAHIITSKETLDLSYKTSTIKSNTAM